MSVFGFYLEQVLRFGAEALSETSRLSMQCWFRIRASIFPTYHPERHYMRGPGPKWREKQRGLDRNSRPMSV